MAGFQRRAAEAAREDAAFQEFLRSRRGQDESIHSLPAESEYLSGSGAADYVPEEEKSGREKWGDAYTHWQKPYRLARRGEQVPHKYLVKVSRKVDRAPTKSYQQVIDKKTGQMTGKIIEDPKFLQVTTPQGWREYMHSLELCHDQVLRLAQGTARYDVQKRHWGGLVKAFRRCVAYMEGRFFATEGKTQQMRKKGRALDKKVCKHVLGIYAETGIVFCHDSFDLMQLCEQQQPEKRTKAEHKDPYEEQYERSMGCDTAGASAQQLAAAKVKAEARKQELKSLQKKVQELLRPGTPVFPG